MKDLTCIQRISSYSASKLDAALIYNFFLLFSLFPHQVQPVLRAVYQAQRPESTDDVRGYCGAGPAPLHWHVGDHQDPQDGLPSEDQVSTLHREVRYVYLIEIDS